MIKGTVEVGFRSESDAKAAMAALKSDVAEYERSKPSISMNGKDVVLTVRATDVVALRASLNTYLRLLSVVAAGLREGI